MQQASAPDRFPNLFVSILFVVFNLEGIVGEQSFYPLIIGNIEQDFSIVYPSGSPGFGLFVVFAFGDCDLISLELRSVVSMSDQCLFLGHFQMEFVPDKAAYILFNLFCVLFVADNSD